MIIRVANWDKYQHYKHRSPIWFKLYTALQENAEFQVMDDSTKAHWFGLLILAAKTGNKIVVRDLQHLSYQLWATEPVQLQVLVDAGFIVVESSASKVASNSASVSASKVASVNGNIVLARFETNLSSESELESEADLDTEQEPPLPPSPPAPSAPCIVEPEAQRAVVQQTFIPASPEKPKSKSADIEAAFQQVWQAYPSKRRKGIFAAKAAFGKKAAGVPVDELLAAIEKQKQSKDWTKDGGQYIPLLTTWLNQGRWMDADDAPERPAGYAQNPCAWDE